MSRASDLQRPVAYAELVGRELDLIGVQGRLQDPSLRLLTLTGPGGVGKSRLAAEAARSLSAEFARGVRTVDVPGVGSLDAPADAVCRAVGELVAPSGGQLDRRRGLVVVDGIEHVAEHLAPEIAALLDERPWLTVLATGQRALRLYGEHVLPVAPLPPPGPLLDPEPADVQDNPAVRLFTLRAREANPAIGLTAESAGTVVDVCNLLEGMPLALELAARRLRLFPFQELYAWLLRGGDSHQAGPVDAPPRQRSVSAVAEWSCRGLSGGQRALLARLALFRGGATLATAERVSPLGPAETAEALEALLERGLLALAERPGAEGRLTMSRTLRLHGLALLDAAGGEAEAAAARQAHARHYQELMHTLEGRFHGSEQRRWLRAADAEHANVLAALDHLKRTPGTSGTSGTPGTSGPSGTLAARADLVAACLLPWLVRGELAEGLRWFDRTDAELRESEAAAEAEGRDAEGHDTEGQALRRRARLCTGAGTLAAALGDHDGAAHRFRRAVALCKRLRESRPGALASARLGLALFHCGDRPVARSLLTAAAAALESHGDTSGTAEAVTALAEVLLDAGELGEAEALLEKAVRIHRQSGAVRDLARTRRVAARLALRQNDPGAARAALREALDLYGSLGERTELPAALDEFALLLSQDGGSGEAQRAARLFAAADALRRCTGVRTAAAHWDQVEEATAALRRRLGWGVFATAWTEGARLRPQAMAAEALAAAEPVREREEGPAVALTPRQLQVALLVAEGMTNRQIAQELNIAEWTVVNHVRQVMRRLGCASRVQVAWAVGRRQ